MSLTPLLTLVQTTSYDFTPNKFRLPPIVWTTFTALNKVHGLWRWYRRAELYSKPEHLGSLIAGHLVNWAIGNHLIVRLAAQSLLVATRILDCSQQQARLCRAGRRWTNAVKGQYPAPVYVNWDTTTTSTWLSPSTVYWWRRMGVTIWERICRIALCTFDLFKKAFRLSMNIMDVIDAFCWSPAAKNDAVCESFVNIGKWMTAIVNNKDELLEGLEKNREIIERILKGAPLTYEKLYTAVKGGIIKVVVFQNAMQKISSVGKSTLIRRGKRLINKAVIKIKIAGLRRKAKKLEKEQAKKAHTRMKLAQEKAIATKGP